MTDERLLFRESVYDSRSTRGIADALVPRADTLTVRRRWGVVAAIGIDVLDVTIDGILVQDVRYVASYVPVVGERIRLDCVGTDLVVVEPLAPSSRNGQVPLFSGYCTTALEMASGVLNFIPLDTVEVDTHDFHSTTVNPSRYTPTIPGWYEVHVIANKEMAWSTNNVAVSICKNGTLIAGGDLLVTADKTYRLGHTRIIYLNGISDYAQGSFYQDTGSPKNLVVISGASALIEVKLVRYG